MEFVRDETDSMKHEAYERIPLQRIMKASQPAFLLQ